ncbi:hypothetical protein GP486_006261 [Trichoglossum hirsutum]|uniref:CFEM domain-containing protein n=1 Tax=Trichoglossum hirsutum TaxID=265104 RepID=A0A9P8IE03_9PEZI|nr:hypothetical protein GP486_006261 [Trichoglossum hirsutum]
MHPLLPLFSTLLVSLFSSVSFSQSQQLKTACSLSGYSNCVCTSCIVPIFPNYCPNILDVTCPCLSTQYQSDATACVLANCSAAEGQRAWSIGSSACRSYGITLPTTPPAPSSIKSSSRNTATQDQNAASATADANGGKSTGSAGNNSSSSSGNRGLSTAAIVGIVVGVISGIAIGALIAYLFLRNRQPRQASQPPPPQPPPQPQQPPVQQPPVQQLAAQPPLVDKPYIGVAYSSPPPGQELHSDPATHLPPTHGQQQGVLPIPELQSPDGNQGQPLPAPTPQWSGYTTSPPPLYEMPNR